MKKFYIFLSMVIAALTAGAGTVTDVITTANFDEVNTQGYTNLGSYTAPSGNTYSAYAAVSEKDGGKEFAFNSSSRSTGLIATDVIDGVIRKVTLEWPNANAARVINIYGSDTPFSISDMYGSNLTKIGSITKLAGESSTVGTYEIPSEYNYKYVGIRSNSQIIYIKEVTFEYETAAAPAPSE